MKVRIALRTLPHGVGLQVPAYESAGAAGMDLRAAEDATLEPGARALVPTGFAMALPNGFEGQVRPRSGLAVRHGISVLNAPGTIDSDYRGEIKVALINLGHERVDIARGDRIAQLVIAPVVQGEWIMSDDLDATDRGNRGFGSTGLA